MIGFLKNGEAGETKVTWQNNGELPFPLARLMGPLLKKNLDKQFGEGLKNLKNYAKDIQHEQSCSLLISG